MYPNKNQISSLFLFIGLFFLTGFQCYSQSYAFQQYSVKEGLPQSQVTSIIQDSKGYLWIGTYGGGVIKFDGKDMVIISDKVGLSDNRILSIMEDPDGNIWVGVENGGLNKIVLNQSQIDQKSIIQKNDLIFNIEYFLEETTIRDIEQDNNGNIWAAAEDGLYKLTSDLQQHFTIDNGLTNNRIWTLLFDQNMKLWVGTARGLCVATFNDDKIKFTALTKKHGLKGKFINTIHQDKNRNIWIGTYGGGASCLDNNNYKLILEHINSNTPIDNLSNLFINFTKQTGLSNNIVNSIIDDYSGNIWLATAGGLSKIFHGINPSAKSHIRIYTQKHGLSINSVNCIIEDTEGNLWLGTEGGGVNKFMGETFSNLSIINGLPGNIVYSLFEDKDGSYLFGTNNGLSYHHANATGDWIFSNFNLTDGLTDNHVLAIDQDNNGSYWVGTNKGVTQINININGSATFKQFTKSEGYTNQGTWDIFKDSEGILWFATANGLFKYDGKNFQKFTENEGLSRNRINYIMEDTKHNLWLGTWGGGINTLIKDNNAEIRYRIKIFDENNGLDNALISTILEDSTGNMWFGTYGEGVIKYDGQNITRFTIEDGLSDNGIYSMCFDNSNNLWLGTNNGINKFDVKKYFKTGIKDFKHYGIEEGFSGIECNSNAIIKDQSGNLWYGTIDGVLRYNPKNYQKNLTEPKTNITRKRIFLRDTILESNVVLPHYLNHLTFNFIGISHTNPKKVSYQYFLEGFDKTWSPITSDNVATYSNIHAGPYSFQVKACNNEGIWNKEPTTFNFSITPPFWATLWFKSALFIITLLSVFTMIKLRTKNLRQTKKILENKVLERTQQLLERTDQLNEKNEALESANNEINNKNTELEEANNEIKRKNEKLWQTSLAVNKTKEKVQQVNAKLKQLSIVASETDNAVIILNARGDMEWVNLGFTRMSGYTLEQFTNQFGINFIKNSSNPEFEKILNQCISTKKSVTYEAENKHKEGRKFWTQTTLTPIFDEDKKLDKLVAIDTDITERKKSEEIIQQKNKDITDSINYASRIQYAILTPLETLYNHLPRSFVYFRPKDVVSGDFYWFSSLPESDEVIIAACDCTGHGVPGAFMSMIGNDMLNQIINEKGITQPAEILNNLHTGIKAVLRQDTDDTSSMDGMDLALCKVNLKNRELVYAGAHRPLVIVRAKKQGFATTAGKTHINIPTGILTDVQTLTSTSATKVIELDSNIEIIKADKRGIGGLVIDERNYTNHVIPMNAKDSFYIFSDGFPDQFGGPKQKKYSTKRAQQFFGSIQHLNIRDQEKALDREIAGWKGKEEQIDDILVIGVRF